MEQIGSRSVNFREVICVSIILLAGSLSFFSEDFHPFMSIVVISSISLFYFIIHLIITKQISQIFVSLITTVIFVLICSVIPVIGWIGLLLLLIYNISESVKSLRVLFKDACYTLLVYCTLFLPMWFDISSSLAFMVYASSVIAFANRMNKCHIQPKDIFYRYSLAYLSSALIALIIVSIFASLRNFFNVNVSASQVKMSTPQAVSGYTTSAGTAVEGYTRNVVQTVTQQTSHVTAGSGAFLASASGSVGNTISEEDQRARDKVERHSLDNSNNAYETISYEEEPSDLPPSDSSLNFYRYGDIPERKIVNFIDDLPSEHLPDLRDEDIGLYFDDTVFGKGAKGVMVTSSYLIVNLGMQTPYYLELEDLKNISISGRFNRKLNIACKNGDQYEIVLTQSNKGAQRVKESIDIIIDALNGKTFVY